MSKTHSPAEEDSPSGVLERTLAVMELLSANAQGMQLADIADGLRIPRSATHRVLTSLVERGYVRQERRHGGYQLTVKIATLAFNFLAGLGVTDLAQPILDRLARETGELVRLAVVDGERLIWVAKAQGPQFGLRYDPEMGQVARLSCSSSGIAWLSCLPEAEALALVEKQGYGSRAEYGPKAPQTAQAFLKYLRAARKNGYALTVQTYTDRMNAIAAPVRDAFGREVIGAVNISGPHMRLTEARMLEMTPRLLEAARELSVAMVATSPAGARRSGPHDNYLAPTP